MENIEKLPILRTAYAAHKQFLSIMFSLRGFFLFLLPILLVSVGLQALRQLSSSWLQTSSLSGDAVVVPLLLVFIFLFLYAMFNAFIAVKWHRMMILDEMVNVKPYQGQWLSLKFLWKSFKLGLVWILLLLPLVGVFVGVTTLFEGQQTVIAFSSIPLLILFIIAFLMLLGMSLSLPATAVGVSLKIKDAFKLSKGIRLRLLGTTFVAGLPVMIVMAVLGFIAFFILFTSLSGVSILPGVWGLVVFIACIVMFLLASLWAMFVGIGVLSIFYMHYIVPQLPMLKADEDVKDAELIDADVE
ncbi:MAG: hypothetical protein CMF61_06385 [Magnetococcales bacterium]|nr:hypothetical protein [Magnetococcales bacterium]